MNLGLADKVVLITGAAGGLGSALTRAFAKEGAKLIIHHGFAHERAAARRLAREVRTESLLVQAELSAEEQVRALFSRVRQRFGRVDVLVNNAGRSPYEGIPVAEHAATMWDELYRTNLLTAALCTREFLSALRRQRSAGSAVFISSTAGTDGEAGNAIYAAMKAAMIGLCLSIKQEGAHQLHPHASFRANVVAPGWTLTRMPAVRAFLRNRQAVTGALQTRSLPRLTEAEDVAHLVVFLSSERVARALTGQVFRADCGMDRRLQWQPEELEEAYARLLQRYGEAQAPRSARADKKGVPRCASKMSRC